MMTEALMGISGDIGLAIWPILWGQGWGTFQLVLLFAHILPVLYTGPGVINGQNAVCSTIMTNGGEFAKGEFAGAGGEQYVSNCSHRNLTSIPKGNSFQYTSTTYLLIDYNIINEIDYDAFNLWEGILKLNISNNNISMIEDYAFITLNQLTILDISNNIIRKLSNNVFQGLICLKQVFLQGNDLHSISPKVFGLLLSTTKISIDISRNYNLNCQELCWLNYDVYRNPTPRLLLINIVHCIENGFRVNFAGSWTHLCGMWCNENITNTTMPEKIVNSDALSQLLSMRVCNTCYEREGAERLFKLICNKANGLWSLYDNKCKLVKCSAPPEIENGIILVNFDTAEIVHCGKWVTYKCDPGYIFENELLEHAKCVSVNEGSLVGQYKNNWVGKKAGEAFILPKCTSEKDKNMNNNKSRKVAIGIGISILLLLGLAFGIFCTCRLYSNRQRQRLRQISDEQEGIALSLRHIRFRTDRPIPRVEEGGTFSTTGTYKRQRTQQRGSAYSIYSCDGYLKPVDIRSFTRKRRNSSPDNMQDTLERFTNLGGDINKPRTVPERVLRISMVMSLIQDGIMSDSNDSNENNNPLHIYEEIPGQDDPEFDLYTPMSMPLTMFAQSNRTYMSMNNLSTYTNINQRRVLGSQPMPPSLIGRPLPETPETVSVVDPGVCRSPPTPLGEMLDMPLVDYRDMHVPES